MKIKISTKHIQIDRAQSRMVIVIAVATVITVFCLVSAKALLSQAAYQRKVLNETNRATAQIKENVENASTLVEQYKEVLIGDEAENVIGGRNTNDVLGPPHGTNAKIILNALPTTYDFPALVTSVSSILTGANMGNPNLAGTDQSSEINNVPSPSPEPTTISISVSGTANYANIKQVVNDFERSIRPFDVTNFSLSGGEDSMQLSMTLNTYFQPAKALTIGTKEVK